MLFEPTVDPLCASVGDEDRRKNLSPKPLNPKP